MGSFGAVPNYIGSVAVGIYGVVLAVEKIHHVVGSFNGSVFDRIGCFPVAARQICDLLTAERIPVGVFYLVGNLLLVSGNAERDGVDRAVAAVIIRPLFGKSGFAGIVHAVFDVVALGGEDVVQSIVRAVAHCEVVVALFKDVGALCSVGVFVCGVVAGQILKVELYFDGFGRAGLKNVGLIEIDELNGRFFDVVLLIIVGIRRLGIYLHARFAGDVARVGNIYGDVGKNFVRTLVYREVCDVEIEFGVRLTVTETVDNLVGIVPAVVGRSVYTGRRVGIAIGIDYRIVVSGFVITIADIQAFGFDDVFLRTPSGNLVGVRPGIVAHVHHCGSRKIVCGIDVVKAAGRIDVAAEDVGHAQKTVVAGMTYPQDSVDGVVIFEFAYFDCGVGVYKHYYLIEIVGCELDGVLFVLGEVQRFGAFALHSVCKAALDIVVAFARAPADYNYGRVAVLRKACRIIGVGRGELFERRFFGVICFGSGGLKIEFARNSFVHRRHGGVNFEARAGGNAVAVKL